MFVIFRLLLSFWFQKMALAGCLETWHWGRGMTCSQAEEKADSWAKNRDHAICYLFVKESLFSVQGEGWLLVVGYVLNKFSLK